MLMPFRYLIRKQKQQGENMKYEQKAELQDSNKARMYEEKKIEKKEIRKELQSILKDYHYNSDTENMSKDVVIALENLVGGLK
jgi:hypothetical protein